MALCAQIHNVPVTGGDRAVITIRHQPDRFGEKGTDLLGNSNPLCLEISFLLGTKITKVMIYFIPTSCDASRNAGRPMYAINSMEWLLGIPSGAQTRKELYLSRRI